MALVGNTHIVRGSAEDIAGLVSLLKKEGIETRGNPDVYMREYQRFGIEEARSLRERASLRPVGDRRMFIIATSGMTNEAQNALLKTLEEPAANAMFFFIVPSPHILLPTLRSRAQMLTLTDVHATDDIVDGKAFLAATSQKRLDMLKPLLEKDDDDPEADAPRRNGAGKRDIGNIIAFLSSLEKTLDKNPDGLRVVYRARKYIGDKGALVKPLLEQVALLVPRV